jgi:hypothetical protein
MSILMQSKTRCFKERFCGPAMLGPGEQRP